MGRPTESCESWAQRQKHTDGSQFVRACAAAGARPMHPDWARSALDQCRETAAFFFKQWGEYVWRANRGESTGSQKHYFDDGVWVELVGKKAAGRELDGHTWDEFPEVAHA